jgi:hypothetical protein
MRRAELLTLRVARLPADDAAVLRVPAELIDALAAHWMNDSTISPSTRQIMAA